MLILEPYSTPYSHKIKGYSLGYQDQSGYDDTTFVVATEENISIMSREMFSLQNSLQASEQKTTKSEQENRVPEEEVQQIQVKNSPTNEMKLTIQGELVTLEATMKQVYEEFFMIKQTIVTLLKA